MILWEDACKCLHCTKALEGSRDSKGKAACLQSNLCIAYATPVNKAEFLKFATDTPWSGAINYQILYSIWDNAKNKNIEASMKQPRTRLSKNWGKRNLTAGWYTTGDSGYKSIPSNWYIFKENNSA